MTSSPPNTHPLTLFIERVVQTPQPGGYALINITLNAPITLSLAQQFGAFYWHPLQANTAPLAMYLFDQTPLNLQLLSPTTLDDAALLQWTNAHITLQTAPQPVFNNALFNTLINSPTAQQANLLILASEARLANALYLAKQRQAKQRQTKANTPHQTGNTLVLLHASKTFGFVVKPARFMVPSMPAQAIGACELLEDWGIANRLASEAELVGCYPGHLDQLLTLWASAQPNPAYLKDINNVNSINDMSQDWQVISFVDDEQYADIKIACAQFDWLNLTTPLHV
ncbi:hypothetical protein [Thiomicrorhabdus aquaedulcis]|uniref:hypothetical protein n=1 Tax=Thiomicrorhabdus aquaedulcis TaxID=2211106 RepID=UPI000FDC62C2|nr:hypothetical protein [Thiomicrorhabdus aquaedulcis]